MYASVLGGLFVVFKPISKQLPDTFNEFFDLKVM